MALSSSEFGSPRGLSLHARGMLSGQVKYWEGARFVLADVPIDRQAAANILPFGLWPTDPAMMTLFVADYPKTSFTVPYKEAAVLIHCRSLLGRAVHCPWMVVDDDTALIYGRELLGYPKKFAQIRFEEAGVKISASVKRRGVEVIHIEAEKGVAEPQPEPVFFRKTINAGGLGQFLLFQLLWLLKPIEVFYESNSAKIKLEIFESAFDPLASLKPQPPTTGRFAVTDILGSKILLPVGIAGPGWLKRTFTWRME